MINNILITVQPLSHRFICHWNNILCDIFACILFDSLCSLFNVCNVFDI